MHIIPPKQPKKKRDKQHLSTKVTRIANWLRGWIYEEIETLKPQKPLFLETCDERWWRLHDLNDKYHKYDVSNQQCRACIHASYPVENSLCSKTPGKFATNLPRCLTQWCLYSLAIKQLHKTQWTSNKKHTCHSWRKRCPADLLTCPNARSGIGGVCVTKGTGLLASFTSGKHKFKHRMT